ncbi:hypothetical protein C900_01965 [Fulvivirga imtechensis AK7]|uniref:Cadherin domain-containing protein n=1 Tax=Fulvivirga imtechensis AK7 TaxID=1237149 RepID=L8JSZ3_9BACT|nr:SBBP repeat-containing protein [Fulvivirga imtechensis]ELR71970.1 hypothetical protein C900_01965 [Fulvivirga imtechensis AK7]
MKQIFLHLFFLSLFISAINNCYAQKVLFATKAGSNSSGSTGDEANSIAVDEEGNVYLTGTILAGSSGAVFGEGEANETTLFINGSFVAKYDNVGKLIWVQQAGASNNSITSYAIDVDDNQNVYISGSFFQEATFGLGQVNETTLSGASGEIFIAKYDKDGNLNWAKGIGGENDDNPGGQGLVVDKNGYVYVTGAFWGTVIFGKGEANETILEGQNTDIFISKYAPDGTLLWVKSAGGANFDSGKNIDIDNNGYVYVTGNYFDEATFGGGLSNETVLNDGNESSFIAKYDNDGIFIWAIEPFSSGVGDVSGDIKVDESGDVIFTGSFFGSITLGSGSDNETQLTGTGLDEIILAKYNSSGEFIWAKTGISSSDDRGIGLDIDSLSNIFVTGYFGDEIQFGANERNDSTIANLGSGDIFLAKFSTDGEFIWVTSAGSTDWEQGSDVALDKFGNAHLAGFYRGDIVFGDNEANETTLPSNGFNEIYLSKFEKSFNTEPEFEIVGSRVFQEDFSGTQVLEMSQLNTPSEETGQAVSYTISPDNSDLFEFTFDQSTGRLEITSLQDKFGEQSFTITADDGAKENYSYTEVLIITIDPVNDAPYITGLARELTTQTNTSLEISLADLLVTDVDNNFPEDFTLKVMEGENFTVSQNEINPEIDFIGSLSVPVTVNDGELESDNFIVNIEVTEVVGTNIEFTSKDFAVYPNPVIESVTIVLRNNAEPYGVRIFTPQGILLHSSNHRGEKEKSINLHFLRDGIYILQVTKKNKVETVKLQKK